MSDAISVSAPIGGTDRTMSLEAGKLAQLADGAVLARIGDTVVLATAVAARSVREGADFFPLTVDIEERTYAAGKIPGSFFRREGKSSDQAILTCRLIDRPLRPSFPDGFRNEVHIVGTIVGADQVNPHDVLAINGASAALMISGIPFDGPIGAVRVAYTTEGEWVGHPSFEESEEATFELVVAGRALSDASDSEIAIMMVEAGGTERSWSYYEAGAPKVTEEALASGLEAAKQWIRESIVLQRQLVEAFTAARGPIETIPYSTLSDYEDDVWQRVQAVGTDAIVKANLVTSKAERNAALDAAGEEIKAALGDEFAERGGEVKAAIRALTKKLVRKRIVEEGVRIDGRGTADIRPLSAEVDLFPTAHGSALFQRGETQVLNVTTLGMPRMNQLLDTITPVESKRYMHHYNFPPYSTGETGFMRGPKRREIGHGMLAERALLPVIPSEEEFPYALRVVSDVLASNGSTSMASVCGSTLSLMAAGVPIKAPVAGIAMGLVHDGDAYVTLTDILGAEDAFGDMDFKVAGTADAVTALQLDTKIDGLPADVLAKALLQAKEARLTILGVMAGAISEPREHVATSAPKIVSMEIPIDKIGEVIGPKGKVINTLQQETGADIAVDDDGVVGTVTIGAKDGNAVEEARRRISLILDPPTAEVGVVYPGKVVNIT
jgi:polyribonucleotide nucleotidyltransferase